MKTPGQKAWDAHWQGSNGSWSEASDSVRAHWERVAAAVTAPEPKSYGQLAFEARWSCDDRSPVRGWDEMPDFNHEYWERTALAVIAEYRKREGLDK